MKDDHKVARIGPQAGKHKRDYKFTGGKQAKAHGSYTKRDEPKQEWKKSGKMCGYTVGKQTVTNLARIAQRSGNNA